MNHLYYVTPEEYDIAEQNGISRILVWERKYRYGWKNEKCITEPVRQYRNVPKRFKDKAKELGISNAAACVRMGRGWSMEAAYTTPLITEAEKQERARKAKKKRRKFTDEEYKIMEQNGVKVKLAHQRIRENGWDRELAISIPPMKPQESGAMGYEKLKLLYGNANSDLFRRVRT